LAILAACVQTNAWSQAYPIRPVRLIVPFAPGGGNDITSRAIAQQLTELFGQSVIVDNRAGAGGIIGTELIAKAPADGYTIGMGSTSSLSINPMLFRKLPYDPVRDFAPITLATSAPYLIAVHPSVPARSIGELIALAKAKPNSLRFASAGNGSIIHLAGEIFKSMAHVEMLHVPYKGMGPGMIDTLAGHVQVAFGPMVQTVPPVRAGQLRGLAVSSAKRSAVVPDIPTVAESGVPGYDVVGWYGLVAPAATPKPIVQRLNRDVVRVLQSKALKDRMAADGVEVGADTSEHFGAFIRSELAKWGKAVREAKVTLD
jgi:tripartite-type tricarboxylate transporter receptor subunit TctC